MADLVLSYVVLTHFLLLHLGGEMRWLVLSAHKGHNADKSKDLSGNGSKESITSSCPEGAATGEV